MPPRPRRRSTESEVVARHSTIRIAPSCSRRSTPSMRRAAATCYLRTCSTRVPGRGRARRPSLGRALLPAEQHGPLGRALDDELDLARQLVITALALRHGNESGPPWVVDHADGQRRALGIEALDVLLSRDEAEIALPLVRRDRAPGARAAEAARRTPEEWLEDITNDPGHVWRSSWLAACARHAARG